MLFLFVPLFVQSFLQGRQVAGGKAGGEVVAGGVAGGRWQAGNVTLQVMGQTDDPPSPPRQSPGKMSMAGRQVASLNGREGRQVGAGDDSPFPR